ncbi:hypothetical protein IW152_001566 [Coemansia sp. BCRC 34962]|nr:hypothetical protein IW152_001566 [Coemansia sp. BCRC 34962]
MEPNSNNDNIYVFHQGDGFLSPSKPLLFVFPYTESLTLDNIGLHVVSAFSEKHRKLLDKGPRHYVSWYSFPTLQEGLKWYGHKEAILTIYSQPDYTSLSFHKLTKSATRGKTNRELTSLKSKMSEMIKYYETLTATTPALNLGTLLTLKNIYYYDERKMLGGYAFDKRSPEGKEFINAKLVVKREKLLAQRARSANDRRRDQRIDVRRQAMLEN